jgi:hypothetical protein
MEAVSSSKTSAIINQTTQYDILEDIRPYSCCYESLTYYQSCI